MRLELTGQTFGRLTVVRYLGDGKWLCVCECGVETTPLGRNVARGATRSCGCLQKELVIARETTHGMTNTPEHKIWMGMKTRCSNKKRNSFHLYGARGIKVCDRWSSFSNFLADMGPRPSSAHSIERRDNNGPYSPENCCWAVRAQQSRNTRRTRHITIGDETKCLKDWLTALGIPKWIFTSRVKRLGMTDVEALQAQSVTEDFRGAA